MPATAKQQKIEELTARADAALAKKSWFAAERAALEALATAKQAQDFAAIIEVVDRLWDARHPRWKMATDVKRIMVVGETSPEDAKLKKGCYLVQPPQVAAEARRIRLAGVSREVPLAVLCREPLTQTRLVPVVAIAPGVTVRVKIDPPENPKSPDLDWFMDAMQALGDWAIESLDPDLAADRRLEALLERLDAVPEHEGLHREIQQVCRTLMSDSSQAQAGRAKMAP